MNTLVDNNRVEGHDLWKDAEHYEDAHPAYDENEIDEASYSGKGHLVKYWFKKANGEFSGVMDIGNKNNRKELMYGTLRRMIKRHLWFREALERDYGFNTVSRFVEEINFKQEVKEGHYKAKDAQEYKSLAEEEFSILVRAFEQTISLIYFNPLLRKMLIAANGPAIPKEELDAFRESIKSTGLPIVIDRETVGFRGNEKNHGSIFLDKKGDMILHLDSEAEYSIEELCHEFAAYAFMKKSMGKSPNFKRLLIGLRGAEGRLAESKQKFLSYVLLFIDAIAGRSEVMRDALEL